MNWLSYNLILIIYPLENGLRYALLWLLSTICWHVHPSFKLVIFCQHGFDQSDSMCPYTDSLSCNDDVRTIGAFLGKCFLIIGQLYSLGSSKALKMLPCQFTGFVIQKDIAFNWWKTENRVIDSTKIKPNVGKFRPV